MAFHHCISLGSISIPNTITAIARNTFEGCDSLETVQIPDSVTSIGFAAFQGCDSLKSVTIPSSIVLIELAAFNLCSNLSLITFETTDNWFFCNSEGEIFGGALDVAHPTKNAEKFSDYRNDWSHRNFTRKIN